MNDLVEIKRGAIVTNSLIFSQEFNIPHRNLLIKIRELTAEYPAVENDYKKSTFINKQGREYEMYEFGKEAYMFLVMQLGGAKSKETRQLIFEKQQLFIKAFSKMEQMLVNQSNEEWKRIREQTKLARKIETDTIQEFIEYARKQGSSKAEWYYKHFTNATYKALKLLEHNKPKTRELLDTMELSQLIIAEDMISKLIKQEMEAGEHYKVIYEKAKNKLIEFAKTIMINIPKI